MYNLSKELREELERNILPFWMNRMIDQRNGGFLGRMRRRELSSMHVYSGVLLQPTVFYINLNIWKQRQEQKTILSITSLMCKKEAYSGV